MIQSCHDLHACSLCSHASQRSPEIYKNPSASWYNHVMIFTLARYARMLPRDPQRFIRIPRHHDTIMSWSSRLLATLASLHEIHRNLFKLLGIMIGLCHDLHGCSQPSQPSQPSQKSLQIFLLGQKLRRLIKERFLLFNTQSIPTQFIGCKDWRTRSESGIKDCTVFRTIALN